jgi:hypothetical protein
MEFELLVVVLMLVVFDCEGVDSVVLQEVLLDEVGGGCCVLLDMLWLFFGLFFGLLDGLME